MKKMLIAAIALALLATPAFAIVRNTKHDLSSSSASGGSFKSNNYSETCVFCHTPHGGQTGMLAPLWNRSYLPNDYLATELYNSATLEAASKPTTVVAAVNASDAKLCMSCHDGSTILGGTTLLNPANSSANAQPATAGSTAITGNGSLGADLKNDHPIGMVYNTADSTDAELVAYTAAAGGVKAYVGSTAVSLYPYGGGDVMWCSSCHDVHSNTFSPFLTKSNSGSALCTTCHIK